ncbi:MAG TPA: glycosyltransferase family 87 protein [Polyangia bacterium]|nr:glycosyltransferase family 87 protein [Polyangia bacterium]
MKATARTFVFLALLAAAWVSAGAAPVRDAVTGAPRPVDFARDYVTAYARVHEGRGAPPEGEAGNTLGATLGAPRVELLGGPYFIHPPPALLLVLPLVPLGFAGAAWAWLALSLVALAALAACLVEALDGRRAHAVALTVVLLAWPPVLHGLAKGQWSLILAALIALGARDLERGRPRAAGVWLGVAASLKATPALLLVYLVVRERRAARAMLATGVGVAALSIAVNGFAPWIAWFTDAPRDVAAWQTWTANTASLAGVVGRLFAGGPFATPLVAAPGLARALTIALSLALVAALALVTRRAPPTREADRATFAAWLALVVVLNPLAWTHTVILALPALARFARGPAALALVVLSIPRETLLVLAGSIPVQTVPGLALSLHAAALVVFAAVAAKAALSASSSAG